MNNDIKKKLKKTDGDGNTTINAEKSAVANNGSQAAHGNNNHLNDIDGNGNIVSGRDINIQIINVAIDNSINTDAPLNELEKVIQILRETPVAKPVIEKMSDEEFKKLVEKSVNGKKGSLIMAESIFNSCQNDDEYLSSVCNFAKIARKEFVVFLSAITKTKSGENTIEYEVARKVKEELNKRGIGVFWWEDEKIKKHEWNISTKIAMGLAFSSIFVGLAFDSVTKLDDDSCEYNCLSDEYKEYNFFKYEVDKYWDFINDKKNANEFVKGICTPNYLPGKRELRFFTYGKPATYDGYNTMFNNDEKRIQIIGSGLSVDEIVEKVLEVIISLYNPVELNLIPKIWDKKEYEKYENEIKKLFHIAKNTPADYYLEYAVIDEKGNDASSHFIFFLEKVYTDSKPSMRLNMVVKDWNNAFCDYCNYLNDKGEVTEPDKVALLKKAYGMDTNENGIKTNLAYFNEFTITILSQNEFLDEQKNENLEKDKQEHGNLGSQDTKWVYNTLETGRGYTNNGGKAEICSPAKSLRAKIKFSNKYNQFIEEPDSVSFDVNINVAKKDVIKYSTHLSNGKLKIYFDKPLSRDVKIDIVYSSDGVPCLTSTAQRLQNGNSVKIERRRRSRSIDIASNEKNSVSKKTKFRICIPNVNSDTLISENIWEMKYPFIVFQYYGGLKSKSLNERVFDSGSNRTCIYCGNPVHKITGYGTNGYSETNKLKRKMLFKKGKLGCNGDYKDNGSSDTGKRFICFNNELLQGDEKFNDTYFVLPDKYEKKHSTNAIVALIGAAGAGKSTFISRFFNIKLGETGRKYILNSLKETDDVTDAVSSEINNGPVAMATNVLVKIKEKDSEVTPGEKSLEVKKLVNQYRFDYAISPYLKFIHATQGNSNLGKVIRYLPFITSIENNSAKRSSHIALYDVPGENLTNITESSIDPVTEGNFAHQHANGIILFVNDGDNSAKSSNDIPTADKIIDGYIKQYEKIRGKKADNQITDVALAVVLCQFDRIEKKFDINSNVRITAPAVKSTSYIRSELPKYIENCSQEVESYIKKMGENDALIKQINRFKHKKFFAVSSIGHNDSIAVKGDEKLTNFIAEPRNLEYVFLWLMYQMGVID